MHTYLYINTSVNHLYFFVFLVRLTTELHPLLNINMDRVLFYYSPLSIVD